TTGTSFLSREGDLLSLQESLVSQMRSSHCLRGDFDCALRFLSRPDAVEKILDVRLDRNGRLFGVDRLRAPLPRLGIDLIAVLIQDHRCLVALECNRPTVLIGV